MLQDHGTRLRETNQRQAQCQCMHAGIFCTQLQHFVCPYLVKRPWSTHGGSTGSCIACACMRPAAVHWQSTQCVHACSSEKTHVAKRYAQLPLAVLLDQPFIIKMSCWQEDLLADLGAQHSFAWSRSQMDMENLEGTHNSADMSAGVQLMG